MAAAGRRRPPGRARWPRVPWAGRITTDVRAQLEELTDLAPLHQPKSLAALDAVTDRLPGRRRGGQLRHGIHATVPAAASTYALPVEWRERWGVRRYGFHGLSHAYASRRAAALLARSPEGLRVVTCHLGAGASLAAVRTVTASTPPWVSRRSTAW